MTAQASLFDTPFQPLPARLTEPTSLQAARRLNLGERKRQTMQAIRVIRRGGPGSFTADNVRDELLRAGVAWASQIGSVRSRLSQLGHDGLIERCGVAEGRYGSDVTTWICTREGHAWLDGAL